MAVRLNPYINFRDNAREAMEFYRSVLGGELDLNTFADFQASDDPDERDKIMHGQLEADAGTLMGADTPAGMDFAVPSGFAVSLSGDDEETLRGYWDGLSQGGTVTMPLERAEWGDHFGMLVDRFGITWMVNIAGQPQE